MVALCGEWLIGKELQVLMVGLRLSPTPFGLEAAAIRGNPMAHDVPIIQMSGCLEECGDRL